MTTKTEDRLNLNAIRLNYINARNIVSRNIQKAFEENVLFQIFHFDSQGVLSALNVSF